MALTDFCPARSSWQGLGSEWNVAARARAGGTLGAGTGRTGHRGLPAGTFSGRAGADLGSWGRGKAGARPLVQSCQGDTSTWILEAEDPHSQCCRSKQRPGWGQALAGDSFSVPGGLGGPADRGPNLLPEPLAPPATPTCFSCVLRPGPALPCPKALHLLCLGF